MRLRQRLEAAAATAEALAVLPPIEGLLEPPLRSRVPTPPISDQDYDLWSVQLDDVDAEDVREVWLDAYRFTGEAHATGGFALQFQRMARVGPASADVMRGLRQRCADQQLLPGGWLLANVLFSLLDPSDNHAGHEDVHSSGYVVEVSRPQHMGLVLQPLRISSPVARVAGHVACGGVRPTRW